MGTTLERVSLFTLVALLLWVALAVLICAWIRSGRQIGNWTAAPHGPRAQDLPQDVSGRNGQ